MDFSQALLHLKSGKKLTRSNWNGKGMYLYYVPGAAYEPLTDNGKELVNEDGKVQYRAYIAMKTVDNDVVPWVASQTDLLSGDWAVVE